RAIARRRSVLMGHLAVSDRCLAAPGLRQRSERACVTGVAAPAKLLTYGLGSVRSADRVPGVGAGQVLLRDVVGGLRVGHLRPVAVQGGSGAGVLVFEE